MIEMRVNSDLLQEALSVAFFMSQNDDGIRKAYITDSPNEPRYKYLGPSGEFQKYMLDTQMTGNEIIACRQADNILHFLNAGFLWDGKHEDKRPTSHFITLMWYHETTSMMQGLIADIHKKFVGRFSNPQMYAHINPFLAEHKEHLSHLPNVAAFGYMLMGLPYKELHDSFVNRNHIANLQEWSKTFQASILKQMRIKLKAEIKVGINNRDHLYYQLNERRDGKIHAILSNDVLLDAVITWAWYLASLTHDIGNVYEVAVRTHQISSELETLLHWDDKRNHPSNDWKPFLDFATCSNTDILSNHKFISLLRNDFDSITEDEIKGFRHIVLGVNYIMKSIFEINSEFSKHDTLLLLIMSWAMQAILLHDGEKDFKENEIDIKFNKIPHAELLFMADKLLLIDKKHLAFVKTPFDAIKFIRSCTEMTISHTFDEDTGNGTINVKYSGLSEDVQIDDFNGKLENEQNELNKYKPFGYTFNLSVS